MTFTVTVNDTTTIHKGEDYDEARKAYRAATREHPDSLVVFAQDHRAMMRRDARRAVPEYVPPPDISTTRAKFLLAKHWR
jgi:hypothetical protein